jgi:hypothetical protein
MMDQSYAKFLAGKAPRAHASGFEPPSMPGHLFDFQQACVELKESYWRQACKHLDQAEAQSRTLFDVKQMVAAQ